MLSRLSFYNRHFGTRVFALKVVAPLVRVLRLVDGEKNPPMGYIYEAMDRAKECILKAFDMKELKYKKIFEIIDNRWSVQLHQDLHGARHRRFIIKIVNNLMWRCKTVCIRPFYDWCQISMCKTKLAHN
jgi:hypothetical protein